MFFGEDLFYNFLVVLDSKYEEFWPVLFHISEGFWVPEKGSMQVATHEYIRGSIIANEKLEIDILLNIINIFTHLFSEFIYLQTVQKAITIDQNSNVINT